MARPFQARIRGPSPCFRRLPLTNRCKQPSLTRDSAVVQRVFFALDCHLAEAVDLTEDAFHEGPSHTS